MQALKILLVDDDEDDYILTQELLSSGIEENKYQLSWCREYSDAINAMLKDRYDLYLVDYKIGRHSGLHLLKEAVKSNCVKPIIILTGKGDKRTDEEALNEGAADYLTKDQINSEILERSIRYATKQFETLETLKRREHTFRILFERSKDAIVISGPSGQILDANKSALNIFGLEYAEIPDINSAFFYRHPGAREAYLETLQKNGAVNDMLVELVTVNGEAKTCCLTSFIEIPQHGDSELFYTFVRDLSDTPQLSLPKEIDDQPYYLKSRLPHSVKAVRTSLSKITAAVETRAELDIYSQDPELFDNIRMNAFFADQALKSLEDELARA